ncbi:MAG: hypothetical protein LCH95_01940 [Proteobacteria bacterium]|nr:hypothetical protein [Pseudomonadota bacterium]
MARVIGGASERLLDGCHRPVSAQPVEFPIRRTEGAQAPEDFEPGALKVLPQPVALLRVSQSAKALQPVSPGQPFKGHPLALLRLSLPRHQFGGSHAPDHRVSEGCRLRIIRRA